MNSKPRNRTETSLHGSSSHPARSGEALEQVRIVHFRKISAGFGLLSIALVNWSMGIHNYAILYIQGSL